MSEKLTWNFPDSCKVRHIDFKDKSLITNLLVKSMLQRTNSMFEWKNLPETIPQHYLEEMIQVNGYVGIIKEQDKLFAVRGGVGGVRNYNYEPTILIVSNPYLLVESKAYNVYYGNDAKIKSPLSNNEPKTVGDCVIIYNDNMYMGLIPLCEYYASQLTENVISKRIVTIMSRAMYVFAAGDEDIKNDFMDFLKDIEDGKLSSILAEGFLGDGATNQVATLPLADKGHDALTDLIEDQQYIKASWYNDFGLQANYNMKRESINSNESQLNKDAVLPFVDNMLAMRKLACKRINELFGVDWDVEFSSAWGYTRDTIEQAIDAIDKENEIKSDSDSGLANQVDDIDTGGEDNEPVQD